MILVCIIVCSVIIFSLAGHVSLRVLRGFFCRGWCAFRELKFLQEIALLWLVAVMFLVVF